ncbi:hypothetical protein [Actinocorallia libanotica]|uniref:Uncharacterized protein n=1 Tax=Actinocorallia libanotica TaxID=46162 RepID=A0ABP4AHH2_9ACTN
MPPEAASVRTRARRRLRTLRAAQFSRLLAGERAARQGNSCLGHRREQCPTPEAHRKKARRAHLKAVKAATDTLTSRYPELYARLYAAASQGAPDAA